MPEPLRQHPGGAQGRVAGAPGLYPALRHREARRHVLQLLKDHLQLHLALQMGKDRLLEVPQQLLFDDEHRLAEAGQPGVVQGVIDDLLPAGPHRVDLLQAAVPAAHARRHNDQYRFAHNSRTSFVISQAPP